MTRKEARMRIESDISSTDKRVTAIRVDRIGAAGERELWWVAEAFEDGSTKPEGMFTDKQDALTLAEQLAGTWGVSVSSAHLA